MIHDKFTVVQNIVQYPTPHYTYDVYENDTHLPSDKAYIDGEILPRVRIDESGTNITFILEFIGGSAQLWKGNGPLASLAKFDDINGWKYGVVMNMNLAELENVDTQKGVKMPPDLKAQLSAFQNSMFTVNHLFMDFENTNLVRFDPSVTSVNGEGDEVMNAFVLLMVSYLKYIVANGNPYVLGYALSTGDDTRYDDKNKVPDDLKPVGTTYTMYKDPVHQELSNLNFVLATQGGNGPEGISGSPGVFDSNWIGAHEQCDAKMVYSHSRLIEAFILEPFYKQFKGQGIQAYQGQRHSVERRVLLRRQEENDDRIRLHDLQSHHWPRPLRQQVHCGFYQPAGKTEDQFERFRLGLREKDQGHGDLHGGGRSQRRRRMVRDHRSDLVQGRQGQSHNQYRSRFRREVPSDEFEQERLRQGVENHRSDPGRNPVDFFDGNHCPLLHKALRGPFGHENSGHRETFPWRWAALAPRFQRRLSSRPDRCFSSKTWRATPKAISISNSPTSPRSVRDR